MSSSQKKSLLVFFLYYIAYASTYTCRLNFSIASAVFEAMGTLSTAQIGVIGSIFSIVYGVMKIPSGYIGDRAPVRIILAVGMLVTAVSNLLIGFFPGFISIAVLWGMNAAGQALLWGPTLRAINETYGPERGKKLCQLVITSCSVGSVVGLLLCGYCSTAFGATACFFIPGSIVLVMTAVILITLRSPKQAQAEKSAVKPKGYGYVLANRDFQRMLFPTLTYGLIRNNLSVWLALYFAARFSIDLKSVSFYVFIIPIFQTVGQMAFPYCCKLLGSEHRVTLLGFIISVAALIPLCLDLVTPAVALVCLGLIAITNAMHGTHFVSLFPTQFASVGSVSMVASLLDVMAYAGSGIGSITFGVMIERWGYPSMYLVWAVTVVLSIAILLIGRTRRSAAA